MSWLCDVAIDYAWFSHKLFLEDNWIVFEDLMESVACVYGQKISM